MKRPIRSVSDLSHPWPAGKTRPRCDTGRFHELLTPARRENPGMVWCWPSPLTSHPCPAGKILEACHKPQGGLLFTPARRGNPSTREATRFLMFLTPARRENPTRRGSFEGIQDSHPCAQGKPSLPFQSLPPPASHPCTQGMPEPSGTAQFHRLLLTPGPQGGTS